MQFAIVISYPLLKPKQLIFSFIFVPQTIIIIFSYNNTMLGEIANFYGVLADASYDKCDGQSARNFLL